MDVKIQATSMLNRIQAATPGTVVLKGGARSGKTYQALIYWVMRLLNENGKKLSIARKYRESHRIAAIQDFERVLRSMQIWNDNSWHKGEFTYTLGTCTIEFLGMDVEEKKMGAARDYLWCNEATELTQNEYRHLAMRTSGNTIMFDFNPKVDVRHWIPSDIMQRDGVTVISSTYRDNPFLTPRQIEEIERIREQDPLFWKVYGEGDFASLAGNIYTNWTSAARFPDGVAHCYGVDFGFTDPTVIVKAARTRGEVDTLHWQEILYRSNMTNQELIAFIKAHGLSGRFYCDGSEPARIEELRRAGIDAIAADKHPGSIRAGIDFCRRHRIVLVGAPNGENEIAQYRWREDRKGLTIDGEPVDYMNHFLDAARYATYTRWFTPEQRAQYASAGKRETAMAGGAW